MRDSNQFSIYRNRIEVIIDYMDQTIVTWLLSLVCAPHLIKNPYLTAKLVEVLFVISPSIQQTTMKIYNMVSGLLHKCDANLRQFSNFRS